MSADRYQRAKSVFLAAIDREGLDRVAYLDNACGDDHELRREVEAMLEADAAEQSDTTAQSAPSELSGSHIGPYQLLQQIGEGGFGSVWVAEQHEPVKRRVALKIIKLGMDTRQVIARFEAERQALAMMDHPNIAKVLDAGATETGRPYFVMELVRGESITEYCDKQNLPVEERLDLFQQTCNAVQHAHQKGIIHRDIKPSNVMITLHDGKPVPKVIDFGIAKATNHRLTEKTVFTEYRQFIGTPEYMSPEQAEMSGIDIDTRSDVYSLGVLLYELLTGTTPFDGEKLRSAGYGEIQRIIREETPVRPSTRLSSLDTLPSVAARRHTEPRKLGLILRGDLDWIVMKCLEKDRTRRYETANAVTADIARHRADEPVTAGRPSAGYKLRKFVRRHRGQVIAAAAFLFVLLVGMATTGAALWWALDERDRATAFAVSEGLAREQANTARDQATDARDQADVARQQAVREKETAEQIMTFMQQNVFGRIDPDVAQVKDPTARDLLLIAADEIDREFRNKPEVEARLRNTFAYQFYKLGDYEHAEEHLNRALDIWATIAPDGSAGEAETRHFLALVYCNGYREYPRAFELGERAAELYEAQLPPGHPTTLQCQADLTYLRASATHGGVPTPDDPELLRILITIQNRGESPASMQARIAGMLFTLNREWAAGNHTDSLDPLRAECQPFLESRNFKSYVPYSLSAFATGFVLPDTPFPDAAEGIATLAVQIGIEELGERHTRTIDAMDRLAYILRRRGKPEQALPHQQRVLELRRELFSDDHDSIPPAVVDVSRVYIDLERFEEAEELLHTWYSRRANADLGTRSLDNALSRLYRAWDNPERQASWEARKAAETSDGP